MAKLVFPEPLMYPPATLDNGLFTPAGLAWRPPLGMTPYGTEPYIRRAEWWYGVWRWV